MNDSKQKLFQRLVEPHFDALYRTARRLTRNSADAEDLVQEACLRAYAQLDALERADRPDAWLHRVQYRLFIDGLRHRNRSPFAESRHDPFAIAASDAPEPDAAVDGEMLEQHLDTAWRLLTHDQRALLALHTEGHTLSDLELITGLNKNAIGVRLHRARSRLAKLLESRLRAPAQWSKLEVSR